MINPQIETTSKTKIYKFSEVLGHSFLVIAGMIIPVITLAVELFTSMSAESFVDPIPTIAHMFLVAIVPVTNASIWFRLRSQTGRFDTLLLVANYFSIGIALIYTLAYLPIMPIAFIATIYLGLGLLPLAPLLSLIVALILRFKFKRILDCNKSRKTKSTLFKHSYLGFIGAISMMLFLELPGMVTNYGLHLYQSSDTQTKQQGITYLRRWGSESVLLEKCYSRSLRLFDLGGFFYKGQANRHSTKIARAAFYQVTGKVFNELPVPSMRSGKVAQFNIFDVSRRLPDQDQGEQWVGGRVKNLWLHSSRIDGSLDTKAGLAYVEWIFEYKNKSNVIVEARKEIQLPPNAVISRVTLWVNGEEREAAIASKQKATRAYRTIVTRRRDPILVTLTGKDRALIQMYPVPVNGIMKARIGFTIPLVTGVSSNEILVLPKINSRNFNIDQQLQHSVWLESSHGKKGARYSGPKNNKSATVKYSKNLRIKLLDKQYQHRLSHFVVDGPGLATKSYSLYPRKLTQSKDKKSKGKSVILKTISKTKINYDQIIVVLDGSHSSLKYRKSVIAAIKKLPTNIKLEFIVASDQAQLLHPLSVLSNEAKERLILKLKNMKLSGGADNIQSLELALDHSLTSDKSKSSAVVWIHGPQPYLLKSMSYLNQFWQRKKHKVTLYYVPTEPGVNEIIKAMPKTVPAYYASTHMMFENSLTKLFGQLTGQVEVVNRHYEQVILKEANLNIHRTSDHLARLWAKSQIDTLLANGTKEDKAQALALSAKFRLVTAVSGAVVLETDRQYSAFGIQKPNLSSGMVPAVPEPGTWMLLLLSGFALIIVVRRLNSRSEQL